MNIVNIYNVLAARKKVLLITIATTVMTTIALSMVMPNTYKASTTLLLNYSGNDSVTGTPVPVQLVTNFMATQADIVASKSVALKVVDKLGLLNRSELKPTSNSLALTEAERRVALAEALLEKLEVKAGRESTTLKLTFKATSAELATLTVNTFASEYQQASSNFKLGPARNASAYFNDQVRLAREHLEQAQGKLSKFQKESGIVNVDSRYDTETARLNELSANLVGIQSQLTEARSRNSQARGNASISPEILANPLIQNLNNELAKARSQFSYVAERFKESHPRYQAQKAEVDKLTAELNRQMAASAGTLTSSVTILQSREAEMNRAFQMQKAKVLDINRQRDQLAVFTREIESAQRAYDAVALRLSQVNLEGQSNQSDVSVLSPATVPTNASSPNLLLNVLASVFIGTVIGSAFCFAAEMLDRRVRSTTDIADILDAPLLATLYRPSRQNARRQSRLAIGFRPSPA